MNLKAIGLILACCLLSSSVILADTIRYVCKNGKCSIENKIVNFEVEGDDLRAIQKVLIDPVRRLITKGGKTLSQPALSALTELIKDLSSVRFFQVIDGYVAPQGRMSGFMYLVESKSVQMTVEALRSIFAFHVKVLESALLHEAMGALGYIDDDYQSSSLLLSLSRMSATIPSEFQNFPLKFQKRSASPSGDLRMNVNHWENQILIAGGSTEIGGGGDPYMAFVKSRVIQDLFEKGEPVLKIINVLNNLRFERQILGPISAEPRLFPLRRYPLLSEDFLKGTKIESIVNKCTFVIAWEPWLGGSLILDLLHKNVLANLNLCGEKFNENN